MIEILQQFTTVEIITYSLLLLTFIYQIVNWSGFLKIAKHRHKARFEQGNLLPSVSIIVILSEGSEWFAQNGLEKLLEQDYQGDWEIVVVNDCAGSDLSDDLEILCHREPRLKYTELKKDPKFPHSRKLPLMIGIKKAQFENLLFADPVATPYSKRWIAMMVKGFTGGDIVLGYTAFSKHTNRLIRSSRLMSSMRWLQAAISHKTYRGIYTNLGYTKSGFFDSKGYTHLNLPVGEDDLYIQKIAAKDNVSVILNPLCTMKERSLGGFWWWFNDQRYRTYAFKFYPMRVKMSIFMELLTKFLFFLAVGSTLFLSLSGLGYMWSWTLAALLFLVRELSVGLIVNKVAKRLGEKKLVLMFLVYDLLNPLSETILAISRRLKPNSNLRLRI